jgi:hypothetical protein
MRFVSAAILVTALALAVPPFGAAVPAQAAPETQVLEDRQCVPFADLELFCYEFRYVTRTVTTSSGNQTFDVDTHTCSWSTLAGTELYRECFDDQQKGLTQEGVLQLFMARGNTRFAAGGVTCSASYRFHFASGRFQYERAAPLTCV